MTYLSLLINTCTTRRYPAGGVLDTYGTPAKVWADYLIGIPCRWSTPSNREVKVGAEVVLADLQLFLNYVDILGNPMDITEQDRVVLNGMTYEVLSASDRQNGTANHHVECLLRRVK